MEEIIKEEDEPPSSKKWQWQLKNTITNLNGVSPGGNIPFKITPYYFNVAKKSEALLKTVLPSSKENIITSDEEEDPLGEKNQSPLPNIIHRYSDRALFLTTGTCSTNCRYCTRSRMVGKEEKFYGKEWWDKAFDYIRNHQEIRDIIVSGGDPLTLPDKSIEYILSNLRNIKHIEIIRIGTKVPVVLPMRITTKLVSIIKKYHPVYMNIHFTHPDEITSEVEEACNRLANAGIPLGSQSVLLKGINDNIDTFKSLFQKLLKIRVRPYYIYQADKVLGTSHFRTPISKGLEIIKGLRGWTSGLGVPHFVIDAPNGGGKIPLLPEYFIKEENEKVYLKNYKDEEFIY